MSSLVILYELAVTNSSLELLFTPFSLPFDHLVVYYLNYITLFR